MLLFVVVADNDDGDDEKEQTDGRMDTHHAFRRLVAVVAESFPLLDTITTTTTMAGYKSSDVTDHN